MEMQIFNPQKVRFETIKVTIDETNTTWFDYCEDLDDIYMITDTSNGLLIREHNSNSPVLVYDITRADIDNNPQKAKVVMEDSMLI